jgi:hypothetical protein
MTGPTRSDNETTTQSLQDHGRIGYRVRGRSFPVYTTNGHDL